MRILFVCTGNVCRSPLAEALARGFLDEVLGPAAGTVGTMSAGVHAVVGSSMEPTAARVLAGLGGDAAGFRAQQLTANMIEGADLTLTMTRRHRRAVLKLAPAAMFRTYTLREAADLLGGVPQESLPPVEGLEERMRSLVAALGARRATRGRVDPSADDVQDPIGCALQVHQAVGSQIFDHLLPVLMALTGTGLSHRAQQRRTLLPA